MVSSLSDHRGIFCIFFETFEKNLAINASMAVKIRLTRMGTKKRPFYRIIATDSRYARSGHMLEVLGTYDPKNLSVPKNSAQKDEKGLTTLKTDRIQYWIKSGAQLSPTVNSLLKRLKFQKTAA